MANSHSPWTLIVKSPTASELELLWASVSREFLQRYHGSVLGIGWSFIQPLALIAIYTLIFSKLMQGKIPGASGAFGYSLYLCSGLIPWTLLSEALSRGPNSFFDHSAMLRRARVPLWMPPLASFLGAAIHFCILMLLFVLFLIISNNLPNASSLGFFSLGLLLQVWLCLALTLLIAMLTVFFRDFGPASALVLQFGFWFTPVVYPLSAIPLWLSEILMWLNPMVCLVAWYQAALLAEVSQPPLSTLTPAFFWAVGLTWATYKFARSHAGEIPDHV